MTEKPWVSASIVIFCGAETAKCQVTAVCGKLPPEEGAALVE